MKKLLIALAAVVITASSYGQGQVWFANRVTGVLDAPVKVVGTETGPGAGYTAQLFLQGAGGALTPLTPPATFRDPLPTAPTASQYWPGTTVDVPVAAGANATFVIRAWQTSAGSYDAALSKGQSDAFTVAVGGGTLPPANLTTLTAFTVTPVPEPTVIALGVLGAAAFMLRRRK